MRKMVEFRFLLLFYIKIIVQTSTNADPAYPNVIHCELTASTIRGLMAANAFTDSAATGSRAKRTILATR